MIFLQIIYKRQIQTTTVLLAQQPVLITLLQLE